MQQQAKKQRKEKEQELNAKKIHNKTSSITQLEEINIHILIFK